MQFKEIVGHSDIKEKLISTVKKNRISHAQLFLGTEGVGKLALAIAYAQFINCENPSENDSCGVCKSCKKFENLAHPDLHFIYPVVKTPKFSKPVSVDYIDKWREFLKLSQYISYNDWLDFIGTDNQQGSIYSQESSEIIRIINLKTFESKYKVLIIYLPEKMNITTANKLLKALEEPPSNTLFVLVSEDESQILTTIRSRTQLVKIKSLTEDEIFEYLVENYHDLDKKQIKDISKISNGNLITAVKFLTNNTESYIVNFELFSKFMRLSYSLKFDEIIELVDNINGLGRERQKQFLEYSLRILRENFILNQSVPDMSFMTEEEKTFSQNFNKFIHKNNINQLYQEFTKAHYDIIRNCSTKILFLDLVLKTARYLKIKN